MLNIKTWQERTGNRNIRPGSVKHMLAEIAELRAALTQLKPKTPEWGNYQRICDLPQVDEAIRNLLADQTNDNATCLVRAIIEAQEKKS